MNEASVTQSLQSLQSLNYSIAAKSRTQHTQDNLKNSLRFIHHTSMQKVIYYNVKKEKNEKKL